MVFAGVGAEAEIKRQSEAAKKSAKVEAEKNGKEGKEL